MKRHLLVTLADKNYVDHAKQLFSSVYFNAGWKGDYMLFANNISEKELKWFRDKGILIKKCKLLYERNLKKGYTPAVLNKFYLFTEEIKKWRNIIYLDADIIVRACLDELTEVKGFVAVLDIPFPKLYLHLQKPEITVFGFSKEIKKELINNFKERDLRSPAFNAGVFAFSTDIIEKGTFSKLEKLFEKYGKNSQFGDQGILNLYFAQKWKKLPLIYNIFPNFSYIYSIRSDKIDAIILHFGGGSTDPYSSRALISEKHQFHNEWNYNLERADNIDLTKIPEGKKWSKKKIFAYTIYFKFGNILYTLMWKSGLILKKLNPRIHSILAKAWKRAI